MGDSGDGVPLASHEPGGAPDAGDGSSDATERGLDSAATATSATTAASSTAAVEPLPTVAGVAGGSESAPPAAPETTTATVFRMDDDDGDALENDSAEAPPSTVASEPSPESSDFGERLPDGSLGQEDGAGAAAVVPPDSEITQEVRRRFQWLNSKDQKTTVRRECHLAEKREAGLAAQLQRTIDTYLQALEANRLAQKLDDGEGPVLSAEAVIKYEERIEFLRGTIAVLEAEPAVSLPQLSALETTKGFVFDSYARTAQSVKQVGDQTGMSEPVVSAASNAVTGARAAFASLSSMVRRRTGSDAENSSAGYPSGNVATVASFINEPEVSNNMGSASSSSQ